VSTHIFRIAAPRPIYTNANILNSFIYNSISKFFLFGNKKED